MAKDFHNTIKPLWQGEMIFIDRGKLGLAVLGKVSTFWGVPEERTWQI
jgi:hypothetical protein